MNEEERFFNIIIQYSSKISMENNTEFYKNQILEKWFDKAVKNYLENNVIEELIPLFVHYIYNT